MGMVMMIYGDFHADLWGFTLYLPVNERFLLEKVAMCVFFVGES